MALGRFWVHKIFHSKYPKFCRHNCYKESCLAVVWLVSRLSVWAQFSPGSHLEKHPRNGDAQRDCRADIRYAFYTCFLVSLVARIIIFYLLWFQSIKYSNYYVRKSAVQLFPMKQMLIRVFSSKTKTQPTKCYWMINTASLHTGQLPGLHRIFSTEQLHLQWEQAGRNWWDDMSQMPPCTFFPLIPFFSDELLLLRDWKLSLSSRMEPS